MKDGKQFRDSKLDDENFVMPALEKWRHGKRTPIWYHCTLDGCWADLRGCDIYAVDSHAFERHMEDAGGGLIEHEKKYDTKYMKTPYAWFVLRKVRPDGTELEIITTHYIYVFDDYVIMFPRRKALEFVKSKGYPVREGDPDPDTGIRAELCTIPKEDMITMPDFVVVPKWAWEEFKPKMVSACAKWEM